jgi:alanine-synthesizing transaminase
MVIHDFAYGETTFDGYKAPSFLQVPGAKKLGVEFSTMSKQYNMAGWRIGFCVGNSEMVRALAKIKGYYDYGIFQAIQIAAIIAMRHCDDNIEHMKHVYQRRRDVLCDGLARIGWPVEKPRGSMFVWARMPEKYLSMGSLDFSMKLMDEAEVSVSPGKGFGEAGEGYLRLALVENENRLRQAVRQIGQALKLKS